VLLCTGVEQSIAVSGRTSGKLFGSTTDELAMGLGKLHIDNICNAWTLLIWDVMRCRLAVNLRNIPEEQMPHLHRGGSQKSGIHHLCFNFNRYSNENIEESGTLRVWVITNIRTFRLKLLHRKTLLKKLMAG